MSDMNQQMIESEFKRQVRLCSGIGYERMQEIVIAAQLSDGVGRALRDQDRALRTCDIVRDSPAPIARGKCRKVWVEACQQIRGRLEKLYKEGPS